MILLRREVAHHLAGIASGRLPAGAGLAVGSGIDDDGDLRGAVCAARVGGGENILVERAWQGSGAHFVLLGGVAIVGAGVLAGILGVFLESRPDMAGLHHAGGQCHPSGRQAALVDGKHIPGFA